VHTVCIGPAFDARLWHLGLQSLHRFGRVYGAAVDRLATRRSNTVTEQSSAAQQRHIRALSRQRPASHCKLYSGAEIARSDVARPDNGAPVIHPCYLVSRFPVSLKRLKVAYSS